MMRQPWLLSLLLFLVSVLGPAGASAGSDAAQPSVTEVAPSQSTACGSIVNDPDSSVFFDASLVYECLTSIPFNPNVALRFLQYYNDTLQFQSTLAYLKNPPDSYQQPAVDLLGGLEWLQDAVNNGSFANQYEFEAALQTLILAAHDGHLSLNAGVLSAFAFASPLDIVSLSIDGVQTPKVYLAEDVFHSDSFESYQPSAISTINGQDAADFLSQLASHNSPGVVDPHADWNQLMFSTAQDVQGFWSVFSGAATFYPGNGSNDEIIFVLENGTALTDRWLGVYNSPGPTGPLETPGDFYNYFVLGFVPASFNYTADAKDTIPSTVTESSTNSSVVVSSVADDSTTTASTISGWDSARAYPTNAAVAQPDLGSSGWVTGYFFPDSSLAVLSIPSFGASDDSFLTFQTAVADFLTKSRASGLTKVVIDLQQNMGGNVVLALDTFRRFFPNVEPHTDSRIRAHPMADVLGQTMTSYFDSLDPSSDPDEVFDLASNEWAATERIDTTTGRNFANWTEFFEPHAENGDWFTTTQQYNLSDKTFAASATQNANFSIFSPTWADKTPPFAPEDVVLLTDGICGSSCALFLHMMQHDAGVRVVAAGGRPKTGPMQGAAGTRGSRYYDIEDLDAQINFAQTVLQDGQVQVSEFGTADANRLPNRTAVTSIFVVSGSVDLRDQVSSSSAPSQAPGTPLQFAYHAADCRMWYTPQTIFNYTALWHHAANAIWNNPTEVLCVANSTGFVVSSVDNETENLHFHDQLSPAPPQPFRLADHVTLTGDGSSVPDTDALAEPLEGIKVVNDVQTPNRCGSSDECTESDEVCWKMDSCTQDTNISFCVKYCNVGSMCSGGECSEKLNSGDLKFLGQSKKPVVLGICLPADQKCPNGGSIRKPTAGAKEALKSFFNEKPTKEQKSTKEQKPRKNLTENTDKSRSKKRKQKGKGERNKA